MDDITIVTGFFNINRDNWKKFERGVEKYFDDFSFWARLHNNLVVYVENEEHARRVKRIREGYNLADKTEVIVTGDCTKICPDVYDSIHAVASNKKQKYCHMLPENPESWNADYCYVTGIKTWCVQDAVKRDLTTDVVAWIDFGYGHGHQSWENENDFDIKWTYDFPEDKITFFSIKPLDDTPLIFTIVSMDTYLTGGLMVGPAGLWEEFWNEMKLSILSLNRVGLMDDDQQIMQMCYMAHPERYHIFPNGGAEEDQTVQFVCPLSCYGGVCSLADQARNIIKYIFGCLERNREFSEKGECGDMLSSYTEIFAG